MAVDPQHRAHAAVRRGGRKIHAQVELPGQLTDRGEPHTRRVTEVGEQDRLGTGHRPLGPGPFVLRHAEPRVVDRDAHTVIDVLQVDHHVGVRGGVPQRVVEQLGDGDRHRLDRVRHQRGPGLKMVVHADSVVSREPRLTPRHRVDEMGLLAGQPDPGPAHHRRHLRAPQRLLVLVVQFEQGLRQFEVFVALLQPPQGVLQAVQRRLDLPRRPAHPGLCRGVDPRALRGQFGAQPVQDVLQRDAQPRAGRLRVQRTRNADVRMRQLPGGGGQAPRRQMLHLGRQRL
nr:hypothetical protein [Streptomyces sp. TRM68367]